MKSKVTVEAGICGFSTTVKVESVDMMKATIELETDCPNIAKMQEDISEVNPLNEFNIKSEESKIRESFLRYGSHVSCPVPAGIIKAVEVAAGLALPKDAVIKIEKEG